MQEKGELKKQTIILGGVLIIVIIVAIILNTSRENNKVISIQRETNSMTKNEMLDNLKGLIEQQEKKEELDTNNIKIENTSSGEIVRYLEKEYD